MNVHELTAEELLAGADISHALIVPPEILRPGDTNKNGSESVLHLKPITMGAFQLILKSARNDSGLIPLLMIKESLEKPSLSLNQVRQLHLGMIRFLIAHIRSISGFTEKKSSES